MTNDERQVAIYRNSKVNREKSNVCSQGKPHLNDEVEQIIYDRYEFEDRRTPISKPLRESALIK